MLTIGGWVLGRANQQGLSIFPAKQRAKEVSSRFLCNLGLTCLGDLVGVLQNQIKSRP